MEVLRLTNGNMAEVAARATEVLRAGGVILYPTDTLYGLGADAFSDAAVEKIYAIKGRDENKPIHAIVSDIKMATAYGGVNDETRARIEKLPKGLVTFIVKKKDIRTGIAKDIDTFGFRIPDNEFCSELLHVFGKPVTATSANVSGKIPERSPDRILEQLGDAERHIDLVIDAGELPARMPSSVVNLVGDTPQVLREGAITKEEILTVLRG